MSLRFTLSPLLRLRRSVEWQRGRQLQEATEQLRRTQDSLRQFDHDLAAEKKRDRDGLTAGRTAAELQFAFLLQENFERNRRRLLADVRRLELLRQDAVAAYRLAYRERELLESLCLQRRRAHQQEQQRREQREVDAMHLAQRWNRPRG